MRNKSPYRHICLLFICFSALISQVYAKAGFSYAKIGMHQGMPSYINYVYEDSGGLIWLATANGLARYDGKELKPYPTFVPDSILHNKQIIQVIEDENKQLWILTYNGVARYDKACDCLTPYMLEGKTILAGAVCKTEDGLIFGGRGKLYRYFYRSDEMEEIRVSPATNDFFIERMQFWDRNTLICSDRKNNKLLLYDINAKNLQPVPFSETNIYADLCVDGNGHLWLTDYNNGIKKISRTGEVLAHYTTRNSKLSSNLVLCITLIDGKIWAGTDGGGVNIIDPVNGQVDVLEHESGNVHSLPVNTILHIHQSKNNNIWLGTARGGLVNVRKTYMKTFSSVPLRNAKGLSENTVLSLFQEPGSEFIWIGTDGGGINRLDTGKNEFKHYPGTWGDKIVSICGYSTDELLISIYSEGFFLFNKKTGERRPFLPLRFKSDNYIKYSRNSSNVYNETANTILLLTNPVIRYYQADGRMEEVENNLPVIPQRMICAIGSDERFSYFHDTQTIYKLEKKGKDLYPVFHSDTAYFINAVAWDRKGTYWIASNRGLYVYQEGGKPTRLGDSLFQETKSVLCDNKGNVWIGAGQNLFSYHPREQKFRLYGESDGLSKNEYLSKPVLLANDQNIYMGGVNGLLCIDADIKDLQQAEDKDLPVLLMDFFVGEENRMYELKNGKIVLPWDSRNIKLRFLVSGDDILRSRMFRYSLDEKYANTLTSYDTELNISSLVSGSYPVCVSYTKKDGRWSARQQVLTLVVLPPWYKSWWFIAIMGILFLAMLSAAVFTILRRKSNRVKWMIKEHERQIYEEKVRFLINISHELRTPLTLIYAPLKKMVDSIQPGDSHYKQLLMVFKQSQRMKDLINMVLDARKMEVGMARLNMGSYHLNRWIRETCVDFIDDEDNNTVIFDYTLDERIGNVAFDKEKCVVILSNLLVNAIKHSPERSVVTIRTELSDNRQNVRISVSDQGPGLENVDTDRLFTRFYQGDNEQGGSGIGLSYAKILVELHKGKIGAYTNPSGEGATFYFELPVSQEQNNPMPENKSYLNELLSSQPANDIDIPDQGIINSINPKEYTILVVDDNMTLVNYIADELKGVFKRVLTANDGKTAYRMACDEKPDIIVSDVMMPGMNGYQLCQTIKEDISVSHIPLILLTARSDDASRKYGYMLGADSYLEKPFDISQLTGKILNKLYNRMQTRKHYQQVGIYLAPIENDLTKTDSLFMEKLNKTIVDNLDNPQLNIPFLCTQVGMSRASLYNKLKAIAGMGANDYINKIRIEQAIKLIKETDLNFTEISEKVGFASSRYFSTAFKQYTGKTPTQYKKE